MKQGMDWTVAKRSATLWTGVMMAALVAIAAVPAASVADEPKPWDASVFIHPNVFKFVTTLPDDGKGEGGGWQEAKAKVPIADTRASPSVRWDCKIKVGMRPRSLAPGWSNGTEALV
jgi:hypothetical protein